MLRIGRATIIVSLGLATALGPSAASAREGFMDRIRLPAWFTFGGGVLALGVSAYFAGEVSRRQSDLDNPGLSCERALDRCLELRDSGATAAILRNAFFVAGVAALGTFVYLAYRDVTRKPRKPRTTVLLGPLGASILW